MKALILVGGFGTRLRPLTFSCPKPLVEFLNKHFIEHQIEALVKVGVEEVILAINYQPEAMYECIQKMEQKVNNFLHFYFQYQIKIVCSQEKEPLGTAGPIRLAQDLIKNNNKDGLFFVFNSDIISEFPLEKMIQFHKTHQHEGTIFVTEVEDPSKYGVIVADENGKIQQFVEKPTQFISNKINAGLYLFNTSIIDRIPVRILEPTSIERVIFPQMASEGQIYQMKLDGFWMDVGQPKDFLKGTGLMLNHYRKICPSQLSHNENIVGNVMIDSSAQIDPSSIIGPNVVIGPDCIIKEGCRLKNCVVLKNSIINNSCWISDSIIGWRCTIGKWVRIEGVSVFGEDVQVKDEIYINESLILPHKAIATNVATKGTILM